MKKKQKAEAESRRKSSYKGNSRNNSKSGGLTFSEKKRLIQLKRILSGKSNETLWTRTQKADRETGAADNK